MAELLELTEREEKMAGRVLLGIAVLFLPVLAAVNLTDSWTLVIAYLALLLLAVGGLTVWVGRNHGMSFRQTFVAILRRKPAHP